MKSKPVRIKMETLEQVLQNLAKRMCETPMPTGDSTVDAETQRLLDVLRKDPSFVSLQFMLQPKEKKDEH